MPSKEMQIVVKCFYDVIDTLKTGEFELIELKVIYDLSNGIANKTQKIIDKIEERRSESEHIGKD